MDCLESLAFEELESREINIENASESTCSWVLHHQCFQRWREQHRSLLWIKGKPGSGKSTLIKHISQNINVENTKNPAAAFTLSFFFHARGSDLQKTRLGLFRSLLYQTLDNFPGSAPRMLKTFNKRFKVTRSNPAWEPGELKEFLMEALRNVLGHHSIRILVDALDECGESEAVKLAEDFHEILQTASSSDGALNICFSCRHYPIVDILAGLTICVEDENFQDIEAYTYNRLEVLGIKDISIAQTLVDKAAGVFQWVSLVINQIVRLKRQRGGTQKDIQTRIKVVPSDLQVSSQARIYLLSMNNTIAHQSVEIMAFNMPQEL